VLAIIFFLSATVTTIADIQKETNIKMEFSQLLEDVNVFNNEHSNLLANEEEETTVTDEDSFQTGEDAIVAGYENFENATSYYSQSYGVLNFNALSFPFAVELWITSVQYPDGDFVQEILAKEVGTFLGGKIGLMMAYYKKSENIVYRNFTWEVAKVDGEWVPNFYNVWSPQTVEEYIAEFGAAPGAPIYDVSTKTTVEELFFQKIKDGDNKIKEYHIQYTLNPTLSTKLYLSFIKYVLDIIQEGFVRSLSFKEITVSAIVDANGYLQTAKYKEKYDFRVYVEKWNVFISASCNSEMNYMYTLYNQEIPYEKPIIPIPE